MKKINLAITGCLGRMGQQIIKSAKQDKNFKLVALTESKKLNKSINGIKIDLNSFLAIPKIFSLLKKFFYAWIRSIVFNFSKFFQ